MTFPAKRLGDVARYINGRAFKKSEWSEVGLPIIRIQNLNDQESEFNYCNSKIEDRYHIFNGDILISWSASLDIYIWNRGEALLNQHIFKVELNEQLIDREYFFHSIKAVLDEMRTKTQGATMKHITRPKFLSIEIPLPPLPEQKRIVKILDEVFEGIEKAKENTEKNLRKSRELFESTLENAFTNSEVDWESASLEDVCRISSKLVDPREREFVDLAHVGGANIESRDGNLINLQTAREEKLKSGKFIFDKSMVLYSKIRPYLMKVARPNFSGLCSADIYPLSPEPSKIIRDYLFYLLLTTDFTQYAIKGSGRAGMPKVNREHLFEYRFSLPPLKVQKQITAKLDSLSSETKKLEAIYQKKLEDLEELKKSVLKKAFTGEL